MSTADIPQNRQDSAAAFLADIAPYFYGRPVSYADLGANNGAAFEAVLDSGLALNHILLVEANPEVFTRLEETVARHAPTPNLRYLNLALSDKSGSVRIKDTSTGASSNRSAQTDKEPMDDHFDVEAKPFDELVDFFPDQHVSILKIEMEGHELDVLKGAEKSLSEQRVDVVHVEAATAEGVARQAYLRDIEDFMSLHGYSVFKIYEQVHDWIRDRPVLRRVNVAFFSQTMIERYPMSLMRNLAELRGKLDQANQLNIQQKQDYEKALQDRFAEIAQLTEIVAGRKEPLAVTGPSSAQAFRSKTDKRQSTNQELHQILGMKRKHLNALFAVLVYLLGVATPLVF